MSSHALRQGFLSALIFIGSIAFANPAPDCAPPASMTDPEGQKCLRAFCEAKSKCQAARTTADGNALKAASTAKTATAGKTQVNRNADANSKTNSLASAAYAEGKKSCERIKPDCDSKCNVAGVKQEAAKKLVQKEQKLCHSAIQGHIADLQKAESETGRLTAGSDKTGEASNGEEKQNQPQAPAPAPQQQPSSQDSASPSAASNSNPSNAPKTEDTAEEKTDPCAGKNSTLYAQCKGKTGEEGEAGIGGTASATCARFKQQCGDNISSCLKTMTSSEQTKIQKECLGGQAATAAEPEAQSHAGFTPQTVGSPIASGGGAGGTGGGSMASPDGAKLGPDLNEIQSHLDTYGAREGTGDNLRVDASGGYSSEAGGANTGGSDPPAEDSGGRGPASHSPGPAISARATDIDKRFGPNIFTISSDVIKARCERGKLNCPQRKK